MVDKRFFDRTRCSLKVHLFRMEVVLSPTCRFYDNYNESVNQLVFVFLKLWNIFVYRCLSDVWIWRTGPLVRPKPFLTVRSSVAKLKFWNYIELQLKKYFFLSKGTFSFNQNFLYRDRLHWVRHLTFFFNYCCEWNVISREW